MRCALAQDARGHEDQQLVLVVVVLSSWNRRPKHRHVAEARHLGLGIAALGLEDAAEHDGLAVVHQHLRDDLARVDARARSRRSRSATSSPTLSLATVRSRMTRLSGVICGVTFRHSTAFLNCVVVAPLDEDSWYGISTPCSIVASRWFAVIRRGEEMISPRLRPARRQLEVDDVVGVEQRQRERPAGFATGRFTM